MPEDAKNDDNREDKKSVEENVEAEAQKENETKVLKAEKWEKSPPQRPIDKDRGIPPPPKPPQQGPSTTQQSQHDQQAQQAQQAYYYQYPHYPYGVHYGQYYHQYYQNYYNQQYRQAQQGQPYNYNYYNPYANYYQNQQYQAPARPPAPPVPPPAYVPPTMSKKRSRKPAIAGALLIVTGIMTLLFSSMILLSGAFLWDFGNNEDNNWLDWQDGNLVDMQGVVSNSEGQPLDNVTVSITDTHLYAVTNSTGQYRLAGVPCGYREIRVEKQGFRTMVYRTQIQEPAKYDPFTHDNPANVSISEGSVTYDFTMTPGSDVVTYGPEMPTSHPTSNRMITLFTACGAVTLIAGILSIVGGIYSMKRQHYGLAIIGASLGIFGFGFALGTILAIVALLILLLSSAEFDKDDRASRENQTIHPPAPSKPSEYAHHEVRREWDGHDERRNSEPAKKVVKKRTI